MRIRKAWRIVVPTVSVPPNSRLCVVINRVSIWKWLSGSFFSCGVERGHEPGPGGSLYFGTCVTNSNTTAKGRQFCPSLELSFLPGSRGVCGVYKER